MFNEMFTKRFNKNLTISLTATLMLISQVSFAQTPTPIDKVSVSIGGLKNNLTQSDTSNLVAKEPVIANQRALALKGMNRTDVHNARQQKAKQILSASVLNQSAEYTSVSHHSFSIYTGYSQLITDIDEDGYYQTFGVTFDADILSPIPNEQAFVYADLYLSQNGGPWVLYFSSDDFLITGENTDDEFEVITQLDSGYVPDHYDVLIDLYEVGYSDVVATYSSNDSNALYALPLESSDYDPEYIEVVYHDEHSGSISWWLLGALLALVYRRRLVQCR